MAHKEIDLKNPKTNRKNAGFTDEERGSLPNFLTRDLLIRFGIFIPIGKEFIPGGRIASAQEQKMPDGGSIFLCFGSLKERLKDAKILTDVMGSDHCPIELDMD